MNAHVARDISCVTASESEDRMTAFPVTEGEEAVCPPNVPSERGLSATEPNGRTGQNVSVQRNLTSDVQSTVDFDTSAVGPLWIYGVHGGRIGLAAS